MNKLIVNDLKTDHCASVYGFGIGYYIPLIISFRCSKCIVRFEVVISVIMNGIN